MGSTRLPGKVLREILGKPMLGHIIERLRGALLVDKIVISTSINSKDNAIEKFALANKIEYYRGSENDLADRLFQTARKFNADAIVRITGDCPLVDPVVVDKVVKCYLKNEGHVDYVSNTLKRTYPDGLDIEVISYKALEKIWQEVQDPFWREWFTMYIVENPSVFRLKNVENETDFSRLRWTVDYEEDLMFVSKVFKKLYVPNHIFHMEDVIELLKKKPHLAKINVKYIGLDTYRRLRRSRFPTSI